MTRKVREALAAGGPLGLMNRCRQAGLRLCHERLIEPLTAGAEPYPTRRAQSLDGLTIQSEHRDAGAYYDPTPRLVIRALLDSIEPAANWHFVDVGTGRGRVVLEAARRPFRSVTGIEFADELARAARANLAALTDAKRVCPQVSIMHGDATTLSPAEGRTAYFLYNPFQASVLTRFLERVLAPSAGRRESLFLYVNPEARAVFDTHPHIEQVALARSIQRRLRIWSIHDVAVYRALT
ncbi:MAG: class I SAM-dependent methyltransferase [Hyphomicrobiaceae bacterium]